MAMSVMPIILRLALLGSLAGDVFLMLPGLFIPGLVAFLLAHIAYIVRLRQEAPWFASNAFEILAPSVSRQIEAGIKYDTVKARQKRGWPEECLFLPRWGRDCHLLKTVA